MGNDDHGERLAVLETIVKQLRQDVSSLMSKSNKWSLQELLIFISVLGTLVAMIAKSLGWSP